MNHTIKITIFVLATCLMLSSCSFLLPSTKPSSSDSSLESSAATSETSGEPDSDGEKYAEMALDNYIDGDYKEAIKNCELAVEKGLTSTPLDMVYKIQGASYADMGMYEEAKPIFEKALEVNDKNYQVWTNLGVAYRQTGDYKKALECYETSYDIEPNYPENLSSLGTLNVLEGEPEKAIKYFEEALALDENLAVTHGNYALALAMVGRFEDADKALTRARVLGYKNADTVQERIDELKK